MSWMLRLQAPRRTPLLCLAAAAAIVVVLLPAAPVLADEVLLVDENTELTADHHGPIEIVESGVTLDCAGFSVLPDAGGAGISFYDVSRVTVRDCVVDGFDEGFNIGGASRIALLNNTVLDSVSAFFLSEVTDSTIRGNSAQMGVAGTMGAAGYVLEYSSGNAVLANSASDFTEIGFGLMDSSGNTLNNNHAEGPGEGYGTGFWVRGPDNVLIENTVSGYFGGVSVDAADNTIKRNVVEGIPSGGSVGITLGFDATRNVVMSNTVSGTGFAGFFAVGGSDNVLADNVSFDNPEGFQLWMTTGNTVTRNHSYSNGIGFLLQTDANDNTLSRNLANDNGQGFLALGASDNTFERNVSTSNGIGFNMGGATEDNILDRNRADMNETGFWDGSEGGWPEGTANHYVRNTCTANTAASDPEGLCSG